jgi:hypothetical protein
MVGKEIGRKGAGGEKEIIYIAASVCMAPRVIAIKKYKRQGPSHGERLRE